VVAAEQSSGGVSSGTEVYAGPAVRLLAREFGVDLARLTGTGTKGRILKEDVQAYVKSRLRAAPAQAAAAEGAGIPAVPLPDFAKFGPVELEPLSRIRRSGAQNLHRSWLNVPHVTQHDEADVSSLEEFRRSIRAEAEKAGVKVTPLSFLVKACCVALKAHPRINASLDAGNNHYILKRYWHIGFAVDAPDGLVVPVIRDADRLGIFELSRVIADLADKARRGKLALADMQGGTFSISSLGALGGTGFTPIVNAPEVAILGVGRLVTRPVWDGKTFQPREMLPLSLSYDHRAINGAEAGRFMVDLCALLADARRLIL
jgi:pyruvate dehydrogenase E2 component (dihydrolipoamide acetyltransferase)